MQPRGTFLESFKKEHLRNRSNGTAKRALWMPLERASGILLHITSLPSRSGIGDLGPAAYRFADFLHAGKQRVWQVLPLNPTGYGNSPYAALSAFAGNPLLISLERLADAGLISHERIGASDPSTESDTDRVDFSAVTARKIPLLKEAALNFLRGDFSEMKGRFERFCHDNCAWLNDWAYYAVLRERFGTDSWSSWPAEFRQRDQQALEQLQETAGEELAVQQVLQFAFEEQWQQLRHYCRERDIRFIGDVAIFVNYDSADVWIHPEIFELNEQRAPLRVAGVPPDYFSQSGQRWGNPLYRWDVLANDEFGWWISRMRRSMQLYDVVRLDHFRGFEAFWAIKAEHETAMHGEWVKAPGSALFRKLREELTGLSLIAEDLGLITAEVTNLREEFAMPGMRILQFGFGDRGAHAYLPHRFVENTVVYTGTHDNNTTVGWWQEDATEIEKTAVQAAFRPGDDGIAWTMIRAASTSVAALCLFPLQDVLDLGGEARMNTPSRPGGNWSWRYADDALQPYLAAKLAALTTVTDRDAEANALQ